jgi:hypothetical protein
VPIGRKCSKFGLFAMYSCGQPLRPFVAPRLDPAVAANFKIIPVRGN